MNGRNKAIALTSVLLLMLSVVVGGVYMASAETDQDDATGSNPPKFMNSWRHGPFVGCLDEGQRQELKETLSEMREEGATFDEIREYVQAYLEELGVELPLKHHAKGFRGFGEPQTEGQSDTGKADTRPTQFFNTLPPHRENAKQAPR